MAVQGYETSIDYEKLYDLCAAGQRVVCFVTYDFEGGRKPEPSMVTDICMARRTETPWKKKRPFFISVGCRGTGFIDSWQNDSKADFIEYCKYYNLEYIMPKVQE